MIVPNPTGHSPNGDGINDVWVIPSLADFHDCTVGVFDRDGQTVFHFTSYNHSWDGTCKGKPIPWGIYYYIIKSKNVFQQLSGSLNYITMKQVFPFLH
jgi:gliding motility-associated-like protein